MKRKFDMKCIIITAYAQFRMFVNDNSLFQEYPDEFKFQFPMFCIFYTRADVSNSLKLSFDFNMI